MYNLQMADFSDARKHQRIDVINQFEKLPPNKEYDIIKMDKDVLKLM